MHHLTLGDVLDEHKRTYAGKTAVVCGGDRHTYSELADRVTRLSRSLRDAGVGPGERVLWMGQNCHRLLELILACARLGAMVCPINWRQSAEEFAFVVHDLKPKVIVWQQEALGETVQAARALAQHEALWIQHDGQGEGSYEAFVAGADSRHGEPGEAVDVRQPVVLLYTAAFDGHPNAAMLTQLGLMTQDANLFLLGGVTPEHIYLNCGPLFHIGSLMFTIATFHIGGTNVFARHSDPQEVMELIERERCVDGFVLPPTIMKILELNSEGQFDLSCFRSPIPIPGWTDMVQFAPSKFFTGGYGQTEVTGFNCFAGYGGREGITTAGRPSPWTRVRILDEDGNEVPAGETGEIEFSGPLVHAGYFNRDAINAERTRSGGWRTNDLGRREADGVISFVGPKTQMIKSGVENIYPAEVETCIEGCAGIKEAAIIGVPDPKFVQSVKAIVVCEPGASVTAEEVIEHCRANIASYKKPKFVEFIDQLPRTAAGAKNYALLDEKFGGGGYPGGTTRSN